MATLPARYILGQALELGAIEACSTSLFFMPPDRRRRIERWLRGRYEARRLAEADCVLVSYGKSGRTWLRVMLSRFFQRACGLPEGHMLEFDNFKRLDPRVPSIFFTHGNYLRDYTGDFSGRASFHGKRVVVLVRDPRDIAVSQYFQWKYRMRPHKKKLNHYPAHGTDLSPFAFIMDEDAGLPAILDFMEIWESEIPNCRDAIVVRYEDMRADPGAALGRILAFLGTPVSPDEIEETVVYASLENMRRLEEKRTFRLSGRRLRPGDRANPDSYKVRRAKVGGWLDYVTDEQAAAINGLVEARPGPLFGYRAIAPLPVDA